MLSHELFKAAVSASSGTALGGLFLAFAAISELFARRGQKKHGKMYAGGAGIAAAIGLSLVTAHGWTGGYARVSTPLTTICVSARVWHCKHSCSPCLYRVSRNI